MDKHKLIGTIIGVSLFAALIAGATFAFLTFSATITNGTYNGGTMNFYVDYTKGTDISYLPQLQEGTPETAASLVVNAKKNNNSIDGYMTIKLSTTSSDDLTTGGIVNWAICKGQCIGDFSAAKNSGVITAGGSTTTPSTISLWTDDVIITEEGTDYYVYFWLDASKINSTYVNQTYSGYIHASAAQVSS